MNVNLNRYKKLKESLKSGRWKKKTSREKEDISSIEQESK